MCVRGGDDKGTVFRFRLEVQGLRGSADPQTIRERGRASWGLLCVCVCVRVVQGVSIIVLVRRRGWC